jgi:hypothetical protein
MDIPTGVMMKLYYERDPWNYGIVIHFVQVVVLRAVHQK